VCVYFILVIHKSTVSASISLACLVQWSFACLLSCAFSWTNKELTEVTETSLASLKCGVETQSSHNRITVYTECIKIQ